MRANYLHEVTRHDSKYKVQNSNTKAVVNNTLVKMIEDIETRQISRQVVLFCIAPGTYVGAGLTSELFEVSL